MSTPFFCGTFTMGDAYGILGNEIFLAFNNQFSSSYSFNRWRSVIRLARGLIGSWSWTWISHTPPCAGGGRALPLEIMITSFFWNILIDFARSASLWSVHTTLPRFNPACLVITWCDTVRGQVLEHNLTGWYRSRYAQNVIFRFKEISIGHPYPSHWLPITHKIIDDLGRQIFDPFPSVVVSPPSRDILNRSAGNVPISTWPFVAHESSIWTE